MIVASSCNGGEEGEWIPLFDGRNLPPFNHYLGKPDPSVDVPGLQRDSLGNYTEGLGWSDPLGVYEVRSVDDEPVIRISGQVIGGLVLADSLADYHLKLKFRWGNLKWDWMRGRPKDGGILYHGGHGTRHEFQIHEGDVGSYWARRVVVDIPADYTTELPDAIREARPFYQDIVSIFRDTMLVFDGASDLHHFEGEDEWQIVVANPYNERAHGEWNTLELICWQNHAVHIVNGKVNLVLLNAYARQDGQKTAMTHGRLALQSEGAEVFFKDVYYKRLAEVPAVLSRFIGEGVRGN
ncbi:MAG: DUF1080 domain-containing protein [Catalinimonas sp.]